MIKTVEDLDVYKMAYKFAMEIFETTKSFPVEEKYSLTDQIRRSSRSVAVNIAEGWGKRNYELSFKRHLIDSMGSLEETKSWLKFCNDCKYINTDKYKLLINESEELGAKLNKLHENWKKF